MKQLTLMLLFSVVFSTSYAQNTTTPTNNIESYAIIRSTIGISGSSKTITTNNGLYIVSQSIGQTSVIGTHTNNSYTIRQGYQQPSILADIIQLPGDNKLKATIYPNPFQQSIFISFNELILNDISIIVFDLNGKIIFSQKFPASQFIELTLDGISNGIYVIEVSSTSKQFSAKLIKR